LENNIDHEKFLNLRADVAKRSLCLRSKCGAIIVQDGIVIAEGYNGPPGDDLSNRKCDIEFPVVNRRKPKTDCSCCVHAEARAIKNALRAGHSLIGSTMYFIRVDDQGNKLFSGVPYCVSCSKLALDEKIAYWVLNHTFRDNAYGAKNYNDLSFDYHLTTAD
jgi:deoxycytidylate deaminase